MNKVLKQKPDCVEAHVLAAVLHNEKGAAKETLSSLAVLDRVSAPDAEALGSRRVLRYVADGLRLRADVLQRQGATAAAFAANCALIDVCARAHGRLPPGCASKRVNSSVDRSLRKISEAAAAGTAGPGAARAALAAYRQCLVPPLSRALTQTVRLKTLRLLFELDMYGAPPATWPAYTAAQRTAAGVSTAAGAGTDVGTFVPESPSEEAALAHAVLQHETASINRDLDGACALLLALERQPGALVALRERTIAGTPDAARAWAQLAYALAAAGRPEAALGVCDQCLFAAPRDYGLLLHAALLCLNQLNNNPKALSYASTAINILNPLIQKEEQKEKQQEKEKEQGQQGQETVQQKEQGKQEQEQKQETKQDENEEDDEECLIPLQFWRSRFHLCAGVAAQKMALGATLDSERKHWEAEAFEHLQRALEDDPRSALAAHFLALQFAELREIDTALLCARRALALDPHAPEAWNTLALLCSAKQWTRPAAAAVAAGLRCAPHSPALRLTQAALRLDVGAASDSLEACAAAAHRARDVSVRLARGGAPGAVQLPAEICLTLSRAFAMLGQWEDAKAALVGQLETSADRDKHALAALLAASANLLLHRRTAAVPGADTDASEEAQSFVDRALAVCPTSIDALLTSAQLAAAAHHPVLEEASIASVLASYPLSHTVCRCPHLSSLTLWHHPCRTDSTGMESNGPHPPQKRHERLR